MTSRSLPRLTRARGLMLAWLGVALLAGLLLWLLAPVLTPFLAALVLAYALQPAVGRLQRHLRLPRALAALLVELIAMAALLGVLLLIVPVISHELPRLREQIRSWPPASTTGWRRGWRSTASASGWTSPASRPSWSSISMPAARTCWPRC